MLLDKYKDFFSASPHDYGQAKEVSRLIDTGDFLPFRAKPYQKSCIKDAQVSKELCQLLDAELVTPSKSPWASPLLILHKKDRGHCILMDY